MVDVTILFYYVKICVYLEKKDQQVPKVKVVISNWQGCSDPAPPLLYAVL